MFMRPHELIALYATEWIILAVIGIGLCGAAAALDAVHLGLRTGTEENAVSRDAFAMIVSVSVALGAETLATTRFRLMSGISCCSLPH
jgi:hypothetical protein